jgi:hypothetical protein
MFVLLLTTLFINYAPKVGGYADITRFSAHF